MTAGDKTLCVRSADLDFHVPAEQVAQFAVSPRDAARLLVVADQPGERSDRVVRELPELLRAGDLLVLNTTRVFPARLLGHKASGGAVEVLLVHPLPGDHSDGERWQALIKGRVRAGSKLFIADHIPLTVEELHADGHRSVRFPAGASVMELAYAHGRIPLPPYIKRADNAEDRERYQSVFAQTSGSVAAPTASLHFTDRLLGQLAAQGVQRAEVELRVGPGTFQPVTHERLEDHVIHHEWCHCPQSTLDAIARTRAAGGRVIAVGTTVVRTLESAWASGRPQPFSGWSDRFLYPPQIIHGCDYLLTNFHLPRSTLLALVSCLIDTPELLDHYRHAVTAGYRFFSYGDAMLVPNRRLASKA